MRIAKTKFESGPANTIASRFMTLCSEKAPARSVGDNSCSESSPSILT